MKEKDFLGDFLGSPARARLLRMFLSDPERAFLLKDAAKRAEVSIQAAARETRSLEKLGILKKGKTFSITLKNGTAKQANGTTKAETWIANSGLKEFAALSRFVHEVSPMRYERIVEALKRSGKVDAIVLSGNFMGDPSRPADIVVAGDELNAPRLEAAIKTLESAFGREIRYACFTMPELRYRLTVQDRLIRDTLDFPHLVLLDRSQLL
jgi:hypothetical protein